MTGNAAVHRRPRLNFQRFSESFEADDTQATRTGLALGEPVLCFPQCDEGLDALGFLENIAGVGALATGDGLATSGGQERVQRFQCESQVLVLRRRARLPRVLN